MARSMTFALRGQLAWLLCGFLGGCGPSSGTYVPPEEDTTEETTPITTSTPGTDADGDGFSVQDGDCDDNEVLVNPGWEEQLGDGLDNDCDGRVDETWAGLATTLQSRDGRSKIIVFDTIGRVDAEITLEEGLVPFDIVPAIGGGWAIVEYPEFTDARRGHKKVVTTLRVVDESGNSTTLAEFDDEVLWYGPMARGLIVHPDGYYLMAGPGALYRIETDGSRTTLASWASDYTDSKSFEFYALGLSVDQLTGTVGIVDLLGGFATWAESTGLVFHKNADLSKSFDSWDGLSFASGAWMDGDGWWGLAFDYYGSGTYALYRFAPENSEWSMVKEWVDPNLVPFVLTTDGDHDEFYVTAKGGDYWTIWKVDLEYDTIDDWYYEVQDGYTLYGIQSLYDSGAGR